MPLSLPAAIIAGGALSAAGSLYSAGQMRRGQQTAIGFQREVGQNRYQWAAEDLEAAGLNRILALGSPATSSGVGIPRYENPLAGAAGTAKQVAFANQEMRNMEATEAKDDSTTDLNRESSTTVVKQGNAYQAQEESNLEQAGLHAANAEGVRLENELRQQRVDFAKKNPVLYNLNFAPAAIGTALGSAKIGADVIKWLRNQKPVTKTPTFDKSLSQ